MHLAQYTRVFNFKATTTQLTRENNGPYPPSLAGSNLNNHYSTLMECQSNILWVFPDDFLV